MNYTQPNERPAAVYLHIGAKRTGKTQGTIDFIADMRRQQHKPVLVFDIGNQSEYDPLLPIEVDDIPRFNELAKRSREPVFRCRTDEIDLFFMYVNLYVRNAAVVYEDATTYMAGNLPEPMRKLLLNSRNNGNDYLFNLHSLADPAPFLFRYSEFIWLRQTADNPDKLPTKVPALEKVRQAMLEIRAENERLHPGSAPKLASRLINLQGL